MMKDRTQTLDEQQPVATNLEEIAAVWSERLRESGGDPDMRRMVDAWCSADPAHAAALRKVESARGLVEAIADSPELLALRNQTLARVAARRRPRGYRTVAMAAVLVLAIAGTFSVTGGSWRQLPASVYEGMRAAVAGEVAYETAIGERLVATLDDGTVLTLNTASRAVVSYKDSQRDIRLERGQALFEVAKDASRPFVVTAAGRRVVALGTAFDVKLSSDTFEVTLIEGRVAVDDAGAPVVPAQASGARQPVSPSRAELSPGQQLVVHASSPMLVRIADTRRVTSWRDGQVIFENDTLGAAVDEMNRYARRRVVLEDPAIAALRISGAFDTGQTGAFVEALTTYFPIEVRQQDDAHVVVAWRR